MVGHCGGVVGAATDPGHKAPAQQIELTSFGCQKERQDREGTGKKEGKEDGGL